MTDLAAERYHFLNHLETFCAQHRGVVGEQIEHPVGQLFASPVVMRLVIGKTYLLDDHGVVSGSEARRRAPLIIEKRSRGNTTVLDIEGAIKLGESAEFFSEALENILRHEKTNVVIDFSGINYIDSTGIGELIGYLSKFSGEHRQVLIVNPSQRILKLLRVVRLDKVFRIFPDEDSAVAYAEAQDPGR